MIQHQVSMCKPLILILQNSKIYKNAATVFEAFVIEIKVCITVCYTFYISQLMVNGEVGPVGGRVLQHAAAVNIPDQGRALNPFLHLAEKLARGLAVDSRTVIRIIVQV